MGLLKDLKKAYNEGYESTAGMQKENPEEHPETDTATEQPNIDESVNENSEKRNEINRGIRSIFFSLLGIFVCLLAGIFVFSFFSAKGSTGFMILGIPIAIFPVILGYFRNGSIAAVLKDSLHVKPEEYLDSQGRRRTRDNGSGFAGMIIGLLILMIVGIFLTIIKIVVLLIKWLVVAIQSKGRAFINPYNVPLLCIAALIGLLVVLNLTNPGMVSFEF